MPKLVRDRTAVVLLDCQRTVAGLLSDAERDRLERRLRVLIQLARALELPTLVTTNLEDSLYGPLMDVITENAPRQTENRLRRNGPFDAFDTPEFNTAVTSTGCDTFLFAGVPTDVAVALTATRASEFGYHGIVLADCSASPEQVAHDLALPRLQASGVTVSTSVSVCAELVRDLSTPHGMAMMKVMAEQVVFNPDGPLRD